MQPFLSPYSALLHVCCPEQDRAVCPRADINQLLHKKWPPLPWSMPMLPSDYRDTLHAGRIGRACKFSLTNSREPEAALFHHPLCIAERQDKVVLTSFPCLICFLKTFCYISLLT